MGTITASRADRLTIGKLSELTGVNIETIRYYEKIKVLPLPLRAENGRRLYGPMERRILAFVRRSRELGFSLDEVSARCYGSAVLKRPRAVKFERLPHATLMISGPRLATSVSLNACWRKLSPNAQAPGHPSAPS